MRLFEDLRTAGNLPVRSPVLAARLYLNNLDHDLNYVHVIEHKLAYARVPKAANSSIKIALNDFLFGRKAFVPGMNRDAYWKKHPSGRVALISAGRLARVDPDCFVFSFTRNPFSRVVSCYYNKIVLRPELPFFFETCGFTKDMSFAAFVDHAMSYGDRVTDMHLRSQVDILSHRGSLRPDFIGRVESIDADWRELRDRLADLRGVRLVPLRKVAINVTREHRPTAAELFDDPGLVRLVRDRYQADFETFYPDMDTPPQD